MLFRSAFGRVIEGLDTVDRIAGTKTGAMDRPVSEQRMKRVTVDTRGEQYSVVKY